MSGSQLPLGLLDLVLARTFSATRQPARHGSLLLASGSVAFKRYAQSAAALKPRMEPQFDHSLVVCVTCSSHSFCSNSSYIFSPRKDERISMHNNPVPRKVTALEEHALQLKKLSEEQVRIEHYLLEARVTSFCADGTTSRWIQVYGRGDHGCLRGFVVNNKRRERSCRNATGRIAFSATGPPKSCSKTVAGTSRRRWKYAFTPYSSEPTRATS